METFLVIGATFLLAGAVKGVIGLGLPTISLAILAVAIDHKSAMALLLIPSFVTNFWQGAVGGHLAMLVRRAWPFLLVATVTVAIGGLALTRVEGPWLKSLLGLLIVAYAIVSLAGWRPTISSARERWLGPLMGLANGVFTGMTGSFTVPSVLYLNALGLSRDALVQAMGVVFTLSTVALAATLGGAGLLNAELGLASLIGLPPAIVGMLAGQQIRKRLSEQLFRKVFFWSLLILGGYIVLPI